nr:uncharacterized protein LOC113823416 [Penaeus vannamei]
MKIKDRRNFVMSKALCINCFAKGHIGKTCPRSFVCNISGCGLKHKFLHMPTRLQVGYVDNTGNPIPVSDQNISTTSSSITTNQSSHYVRTCGGKLAMPIVPARVWRPGSDVYIDTYAMLDPGSNATYCSEFLCNHLGVQGTMRNLELTTLTQNRMSVETTGVFYCFQCERDQHNVVQWPHLRDLDIPEVKADQVHLLIGQDSSDLLLPTDVKRGKQGEPFALLTPLGWVINGPVNPFGKSTNFSYLIQASVPLEGDMKRLWEIEDAFAEEKGWSVSDQKAVDTWNSTLQSLKKTCRHDGKVWYLPHHPVLNPKKPEKCRIVFDCAAKYGGSSLNDHVHQGPDLTNGLVGVLLRFRQGAVGFMADIESMFHQVVEEYRNMYSEVLNTVLRNFYVDDCLKSANSVESAIVLAKQVKELLNRRGFHLTKYISSSPELLKHIPKEDRGKSLISLQLNLEDQSTERALGMLWHAMSVHSYYRLGEYFSNCRLQKGWDEPLPIELEEQWDASENGYGVASYLRVTLEDNSVYINLIMAKSRLAPLKGSTIPRLELAGALEAVRLDKILTKELEIPLEISVYWVDSQIVLWYLNSSDKRFQYVANRVGKILDHTEVSQWRYVPSEENPGDDASRGMSASDLLRNDRWVHGPNFLQCEEHNWPVQPLFRCSELEEFLELKASPVVCSIKSNADHTCKLLNYYSSWFKMKKAVAWYIRLKHFLKRKPRLGPITVKEFKEAERNIILYVQKTLPKEPLQLKKLNPIKGDDDLLRVGGRLTNSQLEEDAKHPVILPHAHHISRLIVESCHLNTGHAGVERVLAEIRRKFWILKGRKFVKSVVYSCVTCKKMFGKTVYQQMANLPRFRVIAYEPPFSRVGVDYFGPFLVKKGHSKMKRYGCIFMCFATRARHIEVAFSFDTDSFIHALERFMARRGEPKEIWSDNSKNFVGAHQELKRGIQEWNQDQIHAHLLKKEIDWKFNPPAASHMGGVWERQIRTIRRVLSSMITQQVLDDEAIITLMTVVEGIINNRPITKLSEDPRDARPLTLDHIMMLRSGPLLPPGQFVEKDQYRRRWKQVQYLADIFWRRWIKEYLSGFQERQKWMKPQRNLENGDLVLIKQDCVPRNQ